jgi:hypothetical protein
VLIFRRVPVILKGKQGGCIKFEIEDCVKTFERFDIPRFQRYFKVAMVGAVPKSGESAM